MICQLEFITPLNQKLFFPSLSPYKIQTAKPKGQVLILEAQENESILGENNNENECLKASFSDIRVHSVRSFFSLFKVAMCPSKGPRNILKI